MSDSRLQQLTEWLREIYDHPTLELSVVSADASFRRYFRFEFEDQSLIAVDAPPDKENCQRFAELSAAFLQHDVNVPKVIKLDTAQGFMVLNDFGDQLLMPIAQQSPFTFDRASDIPEINLHLIESAEGNACIALYKKMLLPLIGVMKVSETTRGELAAYDAEKLMTEMRLMEEWFFPEYLEYTLSEQEQGLIDKTTQQLLQLALAQPQVGVHRDYHSRNLMILADDSVGVIDFQDAVIGPLTYDLVSLLRDCYLVFPNAVVEELLTHFYQLCLQEKLIAQSVSLNEFRRWFDWMGLQRHIKVLGIFARLSYRDGKNSYLADIPRVFDYVIDIAGRYSELSEFQQWMLKTVKPLLLTKASTVTS